MTDYECGHSTDGTIILDSSIMSTSAYLTWAYEDGGVFDGCRQCWECWNVEHQKQINKLKETK